MRAARRRFLDEFRAGLDENPEFNKVIYRRQSEQVTRFRGANTITVVFNLDWPGGHGVAEQSTEDLRALCGAEIFRVKDFLERSLASKVEILDVRSGCITVRYVVPDDVRPSSVKTAVSLLSAVNETYKVLYVKGNVEGRAIRA